MSSGRTTSADLKTSERFAPPRPRRDFLGLAAIWSATTTVVMALLGALRLPMPSVLPESNPRIKLGPLGNFASVPMTTLPEQRLWVYSTPEGLYAVSSVCPHLGCVVAAREDEYFCPCHGSRFDGRGQVLGGPAPRGLVYVELSISPDGQLVADRMKEVAPGARLQV